MNFEYLHPSDQIILMIERIYRYGMTTTSGGNLSIRDENGDIWITPAGVDKGSLKRSDIVCVRTNGEISGHHKPSSEYPFHASIYVARPDLKAIIHAHPPALVSFSIVRRLPNVTMLPGEQEICGEIGMAAYALPGSKQLGDNIAAVFAEGKHTVMLENHGVVVGGVSLFETYKAFETLEFCARMEIQAARIGIPRTLTNKQLEMAIRHADSHPSFVPEGISTIEKKIRREMCEFIHRSYDQRLFTSTQGTFSVKLDHDHFLITPHGLDRKYLEPKNLVLIKNGAVEVGKKASRSMALHQAIYGKQPHIQSVLVAHPPYTMAFAVTDTPFESKTIPESYILLRGTPKLPFEAVYGEEERTAAHFTPDTPIVLIENNCVISTGHSLLNAFDRLEVAEYSAKSIIEAMGLGEIVHMDEKSIKDIDEAFQL